MSKIWFYSNKGRKFYDDRFNNFEKEKQQYIVEMRKFRLLCSLIEVRVVWIHIIEALVYCL